MCYLIIVDIGRENLLNIINSFEIEGEKFYYYDITKISDSSNKLKKLPIVLKILLEANLRKAKNEDEFYKVIDIFVNRNNEKICFYPSRIIMQDSTAIPALVDLASMRDFVKNEKKDLNRVNPQIMVDLVLDHTLNFKADMKEELEQNLEKYEFIKWAESSFSNLRVVPPGSGICHQVNLEYLSTILHVKNVENMFLLYPEIVVGTDSNTTMINSLGVLGLSIEGIEAESAILGLPIYLDLPKVVGIKIKGELKEGITSSDLVIILIKMLKEHKLKGKLVEFFGESLDYITLEDRSTISNLAPEYDAICSFFAIDERTISYFDKTRNSNDYGKIIKTYLQKQQLFYNNEELEYDEIIEIDLSFLEPTIVGPTKSKELVDIKTFKDIAVINQSKNFKDADIVLAAITLCSLTSNPYLMIHAALVAKKAVEFSLSIDSSIKRYFAPNSSVVKEYLEELNLLKYLEQLGFNIVDFVCSANGENYNNLETTAKEEIKLNNLNVCSVTSGDEEFKDKIDPLIKSNYLMSPSLVIIYSLIGTMKFDLFNDVIGEIGDKKIYLKDLWPSDAEVISYLEEIDYTLYKKIYENIFIGNEFWQNLDIKGKDTFFWNEKSVFIQPTKIFEDIKLEKIDIQKAGVLALLGDNIATEQISPIGQIPLYSQAAKYLESKEVKSFEYGTFASRRGDANLMVRAAFDSLNIKNMMVSKEGSFTMDYESNEIVSIFEKSQKFKNQNRALVIFAGKEYGIGSARNWAAKAIRLLGVKAIIAKSFCNRHRLNLIALGVLPLEFIDDDISSLKLKGNEEISIISEEIKKGAIIKAIIYKNELEIQIELKCRLDSDDEVKYYKNGGVLSYQLKNILGEN
ncbi:aconitate hydratase [Halarcobacter ebronensis]|uniref:Aconitate hydratase n=1 Tax=Halarcobacter ebronensis TaxID=1462615 RepID=A0A4Q1ARB1_9BACT|nr:aconitate hydratase [Halarcobacter ebronensis]